MENRNNHFNMGWLQGNQYQREGKYNTDSYFGSDTSSNPTTGVKYTPENNPSAIVYPQNHRNR